MIVCGADEAVARWVSQGLSGRPDMFKLYTAIGIVKDQKLIAGVVYHNYTETINDKPLFCEMSIYSIDKRWTTRHNLNKLFAYPFIQLKLERVQAICSAQDEGVQMFLKRIGFTQEGLHRKAHITGDDALSFGMLRDDCKWIGG